MNKKEIFENEAKIFIESGILKVIYANDEICISNIANQCYGVFPYIKTPAGQGGILIRPEHVKEIIKDNNFVSKLVNLLDKNELANRSIALNEQTYRTMLNVKNRNDIKGPSQDINFEMEEEIMAKNKSR